MKYLKLFEDYSKFNKSNDLDHRSNDFTEQEENSIREFADTKGYRLGEVIGIGYGGVAFDIENHPNKIFKYTYDDIEAGVSGLLKGKQNKYFANVYDVYDLNGSWVIVFEKLNPLDQSTINDLKIISSKLDNNKIGEYNFDDITNVSINGLSYNQKVLYNDLINMRKEAYNIGFDLLDCKIDNLGLKDDHIAMYDVKESGY